MNKICISLLLLFSFSAVTVMPSGKKEITCLGDRLGEEMKNGILFAVGRVSLVGCADGSIRSKLNGFKTVTCGSVRKVDQRVALQYVHEADENIAWGEFIEPLPLGQTASIELGMAAALEGRTLCLNTLTGISEKCVLKGGSLSLPKCLTQIAKGVHAKVCGAGSIDA